MATQLWVELYVKGTMPVLPISFLKHLIKMFDLIFFNFCAFTCPHRHKLV